ncbi:MAG: hypothetical protein RL757_1158 [Bacteroidota bacterium]|jgi:fructokinase
MRNRTIDVLSVGEMLIDMISTDFADHFDDVENFRRIPGGSPANLCMNMARLGNNAKLVACVGNDDLGDFLIRYLQNANFDCEFIEKSTKPTTLILVTRSKTVSNFEAYRGADAEISLKKLSDEVLMNTSIFHTTCFGLSKRPAQTNILKAAQRAVELGCTLSIDANYAQKIWKNRTEAQQIVKKYISGGAFVKMSEVDFERLFQKKLTDANEAADILLDFGAREACVTLGGDGCLVANAHERHFLPARPVEVKDTTGAGDAFWSGYLTARLDGYGLLESAMSGRRMAEIKLGHFGQLPDKIERELIYEDLKLLKI